MIQIYAPGVVASLINTVSCHFLLTRRKPIWYCIFLFIAVTFFDIGSNLLVIHFLGEMPIYRFLLLISPLLYLIYIYKVFEESFAKKLFTMASISMFTMLSILMGTYVIAAIMHKYQIAYLNNWTTLIDYFVSVFIQLLVAISICKIYKSFIKIIDDRLLFYMSFYPLVSVAFLNLNYKTTPISFNMSFNIGSILLFDFFVYLGYINICIAVNSITKTLIQNKDIKIIESQLNLQRENYRSLIEFTEDRSKLKHDLRHHILIVKGMLETGNSERAFKYIQQFNQSELMKDIPVLCMNITADSLIKYYMSIALNKGIDFQTKLNIPEDININSIDLSVILGNCIENSINACEKLCNGESKYIELKTSVIGQQLIIKIKNSFNGVIKKDGEAFISSSHDGCGIGINSIIAAAKKYKGNVDIIYNHNEFEVNIILIV